MTREVTLWINPGFNNEGEPNGLKKCAETDTISEATVITTKCEAVDKEQQPTLN